MTALAGLFLNDGCDADDRRMAMAFKTKSRFESAHFTSASGTAATQLQKALMSDPDHIVPDRMLRPGEQQKLDALRPIQEALNKLFDAQVFLDLFPIPQAEITDQLFGASTEVAVQKFKEKLDIRSPGQRQVDPICGRSTLAQLDDVIRERLEGGGQPTPQPIDPPADKKTFIDFVVRYAGGGGIPTRGPFGLNGLSIDGYKNKSGRRLVPLGAGGLFLDDDGRLTNLDPIQKDFDDINKELQGDNVQVGVICIRGNSSGGRAALQLAALLTTQAQKTPIRFVGIEDAAFFDRDTANVPKGQLIPRVMQAVVNSPIIKALFVITATAGGKQNFWQDKQNRGQLGLRGPFWTSDNKGEIHGKLRDNMGFEDTEFTDDLGNDPHGVAGTRAGVLNAQTISTLMNQL